MQSEKQHPEMEPSFNKHLDPVLLEASYFRIFPSFEPMYSLYGLSLFELRFCNLQLNH